MLNTCVGTVTTHNLRGHSQFTGERGPSWHRSALTNLSRVLLGFPSHVRSRHRARDCAVPQADARQEPSEPGASPVLAPFASRGCGGFVRSPSSGHSRHASDHLPRARMTRRHLNAFFLPEAIIKSDRREKASKITLFVLAVLVLLWPWRFPRRLSQEPCPLQARASKRSPRCRPCGADHGVGRAPPRTAGGLPNNQQPVAHSIGIRFPNPARTSSWDLFLSSICTLQHLVAGAYIQYHGVILFSVPIRPSNTR
jgi:hypothetical protein